jgi:hypothetical protein
MKENHTMQAKMKIDVFVEPPLMEAINAYRKRQPGEIPSKAAAVRELIETGLRVDAGELNDES